MTAKFSASADGTKVSIGNAAEDALQIDSTAKTIKALASYQMAGNGPAFRASRTTTQSFASGTATTILFDAEDFDTDSAYDPATGKFTPQVAGYYQVNADVSLNTNAAGTAGQVIISKNGNTVAQNIAAYTSTSIIFYGQLTVGALVYMNGTTDFLSVIVAVTATNPFVSAGSFSASLVRQA